MHKLNSQITVGIPFFNDELYLEQAIKSVFNQTYTDWKLILIDDGSSDSSVEIANRYSDDERVTIVSDGENRNLACRLNQFIDLTETEYLARMDADDIMHPDRLKKQLEIMQSNSEIDVLGTNAFVIDKENRVFATKYAISNNVVEVNSFLHPSIMAKTTWFRANKYDEDATRSQDVLLWCRTQKSSVFFSTMTPLLFYREVGGTYYIKYFRSAQAFFRVILKNSYKLPLLFLFKRGLTLTLKGCVYFLFSIFNKEHALLKRRNLSINTIDSNYQNYL